MRISDIHRKNKSIKGGKNVGFYKVTMRVDVDRYVYAENEEEALKKGRC